MLKTILLLGIIGAAFHFMDLDSGTFTTGFLPLAVIIVAGLILLVHVIRNSSRRGSGGLDFDDWFDGGDSGGDGGGDGGGGD